MKEKHFILSLRNFHGITPLFKAVFLSSSFPKDCYVKYVLPDGASVWACFFLPHAVVLMAEAMWRGWYHTLIKILRLPGTCLHLALHQIFALMAALVYMVLLSLQFPPLAPELECYRAKPHVFLVEEKTVLQKTSFTNFSSDFVYLLF